MASEEKNHLHVEDADAMKFAKTKTEAERAIIEHRYGQKGMSDLMLGHEAINFELQRLARMTPHQVLTAARGEKWKLRTMQILETVIQNIRRAIGTKMSAEGDAILAKIQENLKLGRMAKSNRAKADMAAKALAEKDADKLESMADMYIQSGDPETGEAMKTTAARIRSEQSESRRPPPQAQRVRLPRQVLPAR